MKKTILTFAFALITFTFIPFSASCAASAESAASATRGRYLAGRGIIMPPEEVLVESFLASIDYNYPEPAREMGVYLYNSTNQMSRSGQEGILQIGIQGKNMDFADLPPMNLVFVIDCSDSMNEEDKIAWVRESAAIFINKIRPIDSLALVTFDDEARVDFASTRMDNAEKKTRFLDAVNAIKPQGSSDLEKGLAAGYEQVLVNFREASVNRVLFFSDGTEFSSRLNREGADSGDVRVSLIWNNRNDLDLHVFTPRGEEIFYGDRNDLTHGMLDVDMNVSGESLKPVENIFWGSQYDAPQGMYRVIVQNYGFHEKNRTPTSFQIEVKNGNEYSQFEGIVSGSGHSSDVEVARFEYKGASALQQEKATIYQLAENYKQMGITTTTIGVGVGFDAELMRKLAEEGGGSSRFISDREEMNKLFDSEFARMVALVATDLDMTLELASGIEILETWGYQHEVEGNRVSYKLPGLHLGDYETILVRYRLLSQSAQGSQSDTEEQKEIARFNVNAKDLSGNLLPAAEYRIQTNLSENTADGISSGMVLHSGTMLRFAESLKEIGELYYAGQDDLTALSQLENGRELSSTEQERADTLKENFLNRLEDAIAITRSCRLELDNAKLRLADSEAFNPELEILVNYDKILGQELVDAGGNPAGNYIGLDDSDSPAAPERSANMELLQNRLSGLYSEIALSFPADETATAALAPFGMRGVEGETPLLTFINENALVNLSGTPNIALVERSRLDALRAEQNLLAEGLLDTDEAIEAGKLLGAQYMITGQIIPMSAQAIVFARVIHVETGEIVSAAQIFVEREAFGDLL